MKTFLYRNLYILFLYMKKQLLFPIGCYILHVDLFDCLTTAENLAYLSMVCSVSLKHLRKLDKWRTKEEVSGLKNYLQQMNRI